VTHFGVGSTEPRFQLKKKKPKTTTQHQVTMVQGPLELSLGDVFEDVAHTPLQNGVARAAKAWEDAAAALARDPALALSPLHLLRSHRFQLPPYPLSAVHTLMDALRKAEDAAATSPSLAGELWQGWLDTTFHHVIMQLSKHGSTDDGRYGTRN
jgi:hypothetical protein